MDVNYLELEKALQKFQSEWLAEYGEQLGNVNPIEDELDKKTVSSFSLWTWLLMKTIFWAKLDKKDERIEQLVSKSEKQRMQIDYLIAKSEKQKTHAKRLKADTTDLKRQLR